MKPEEDSSQVNKRVGDLTWRLATRSASQLDSRSRPVLAGDIPQTTLGMKRPGQRPPRPQTDGMMALHVFLNVLGFHFLMETKRKWVSSSNNILSADSRSKQAENIDLRSIEEKKKRVE